MICPLIIKRVAYSTQKKIATNLKKIYNKPMGRATIMTPEIIAKLEHAFLLGCTDLEACFYADIGKTTLYQYQENNPDFTERKELLKNNPLFIARKSVIDKMVDDGDLALKYLERKAKDEFSTKSEVDKKLSGALTLTGLLNEIDGTTAGIPRTED